MNESPVRSSNSAKTNMDVSKATVQSDVKQLNNTANMDSVANRPIQTIGILTSKKKEESNPANTGGSLGEETNPANTGGSLGEETNPANTGGSLGEETNDLKNKEQKPLLEAFLPENPAMNKISVLGMLSKVLDEKKFDQVKKIIEDDVDGDEEIVQSSKIKSIKEGKEVNLPHPNPTERRKSYKNKTELDRLNEDVRDMFISKDVLMATGKRTCSATNKAKVECKKENEITSSKPIENKPDLEKNNISPHEKFRPLKRLIVVLEKINLNDFNTTTPSKKKTRRRFNWARGNIKKQKRKNVTRSSLTQPSIKTKLSQLSPLTPQSTAHVSMIKRSNLLALQKFSEKPRPCPMSKKYIPNILKIDASDENSDTILKGKSFDSTLKNIYPEIHSKSSYAKKCVLCVYEGDQITNHYILNHTKSEVYTSRLPSNIVADLLEDKNNTPAYCFREKKNLSYFYQCPFCDVSLTLNRKGWIAHFSTHTGEYLFKCTNCCMVMNNMFDIHNHKKLSCPKGHIVVNSYYGKNMKVVQGLLCEICNFVQMVQVNMLNHLKVQHHCRSRYKIFNLINLDNVTKVEKDNVNKLEEEKKPVNLNKNNCDELETQHDNENDSVFPELKGQESQSIKANITKRKLSNKDKDNPPKKLAKIVDNDLTGKNVINICDHVDMISNHNNIRTTAELSNDFSLAEAVNKEYTADSIVDNLSQKFKTPNKISPTKNLQIDQENRGVMIVGSLIKTVNNPTTPTKNAAISDYLSPSPGSLIIDESYDCGKNTGAVSGLQSNILNETTKGQDKGNSEDADDDEWEDIEILSPITVAPANATATSSNLCNSKEKKNKTMLKKLSKLYAAMIPKSSLTKTQKVMDSSQNSIPNTEDVDKNQPKSSNYTDETNLPASTAFLTLSVEPLNDLNDISNLLESTELDSMETDANICDTIEVLGLGDELGSVDLIETDKYLGDQKSTKVLETTEIIEYRINNMGFQISTDKTIKYICLVPNCTFLFTEQQFGIQSHFLLDHPDFRWNGFCYKCEEKVCSDETKMSIVKEFDHMEDHHVRTLKLYLSNENEKNSKPKITLRRLSGDLLSTVSASAVSNVAQEASVTNIEELTNVKTNTPINDVQKSGVATFTISRFPNLMVKQITHNSLNGSRLKSLLASAPKPQAPLKNTQLSILPSEEILNKNMNSDKAQLQEDQHKAKNKSNSSNGLQIASVSSGISVLNGASLKKNTKPSSPVKNSEVATTSNSQITNLLRPKFTIISKSQLEVQQTNKNNNIVIPNLQISNVMSLSNAMDSAIINAIVPSTAPSVNSVSTNEGLQNFLQIQSVCSLSEPTNSFDSRAVKENSTKIILKPWCDGFSKPFGISKLQLRAISLFAQYKCMSSNCFFTTENEDKLIKHFALHTCSRSEIPNDWLECSYCDFRANNNQEYFSHFKKHQNDVFQCPFCFYRSCNDFCVLKHIALYHPNIKNKLIYVGLGEKKKLTDDIKMLAENRFRYVNKIKCHDCEKEFYIIQNFLNHIAVTHKTRKFACSLCLQYIDVTNAATHLKEHSIANYQCVYCTFVSVIREKMVEHLINKHPSNLMYACYRISPTKNAVIAHETVDNSTVLENMNGVVQSFNLRKCAFTLDELNFMSPSLDPKSIQDNKNSTLIILNKTNNFMNCDIPESGESGSDYNIECLSSPTSIKIISVKSLSEIQKQSNLRNPYNLNQSAISQASTFSQNQVPSPLENINKAEEKNASSIMDKILEAIKIIVSDTGFEGTQLYNCAYCTTECYNEEDYSHHLSSCHYKRRIFKCTHCIVRCGHIKTLCKHLLVHRKHRYLCYYCNYTAVSKQNIMKHMLVEHLGHENNLRTVSMGEHNELNECYYIVCPIQISKEDILGYGNRLIITAKNKKSLHKKNYHSKELNLLPHQPIFCKEVFCSECTYRTKVRTNMVRHLSMHLSKKESTAPCSDPVNPICSLSSTEKQFDKMINLACSSNQNKEPSTTLALNGITNNEAIKVREKSNKTNDRVERNIPVFIGKKGLFVCGTPKCKYLTIYDYMLKCHLQTLHLDEKEYICPHCKKTIFENGINIDKIMEHYKFHDSIIIYVCSECTYMHYEKYLVENHIKEYHPMQAVELLTCDRTEVNTTSTSTTEADMPLLETEQSLVINHITEMNSTMKEQINCGFNHLNVTSECSQSNASLSGSNDPAHVKNNEGILEEEEKDKNLKESQTECEDTIKSKQERHNEVLQENLKNTEELRKLNSGDLQITATNTTQAHGLTLKLDIYACFYCSFKNISFKAVQNHWSVHHNKKASLVAKPFSFHISGYMSNDSVECFQPNINKDHLQTLLRMGQKTKRFQCNKCWKLFADGDSVTEHQKIDHPNCDKPPRMLLFCLQTFYICNICEYGSLLEHKTAAHLLNHCKLMKECTLCNENFENIIDFISHLSNHNVTLLNFLTMDKNILDLWNEMFVFYANGLCVKKKNLLTTNADNTNACLQKTVEEFTKIISLSRGVDKSNNSSDGGTQLLIDQTASLPSKIDSIKTVIKLVEQNKKCKKRCKKTEKDRIWLPYAEKRKFYAQELSSSSSDSSSENEDVNGDHQENFKIPYTPLVRRKSMFSELSVPGPSLTRRTSLYYENPVLEKINFIENIEQKKINFIENIEQKKKKRPAPKCMKHLARKQLIPYSFYGKKPEALKLSELFTKSPENSETVITVEMYSILNPINAYVLVEKLNTELINNKT